MLLNQLNFKFLKLILVIFFIPISPTIGKEKLNLKFDDIEVFLEGNFVQGGLVIGKSDPKTEIKFKNKLLRKNSDGYFIIGFGRDHPNIAYSAKIFLR